MDWSTIIGTAVTAGSGGIFGVLGSVTGGVFKFMNRKQDMKEAQAERQHELNLYEKQKEQTQMENEFEIDQINEQGSWDGLAASYGLQITSPDCSMWVNNIKSLFRPFLTTLLVCISAFIIWWLLHNDQGILTQVELNELLKYAVNSIVFSACTAVTWWFGDRALSPPGKK